MYTVGMADPTNGGEHHLERMARALDAAGASYECPSCGHDQWARNTNPVVLKETRPVEVNEVGVPVAGELVGGIPAFALVCRRCGFMRLHSVQALLGDMD
jgi:hypothetical protein